MSTFVSSIIACPCGHESEVKVLASLRASHRPDLRDDILAGRLHQPQCQACGVHLQVETLIAYMDIPRRHWFTVAPPSGLRRRAEWLHLAEESFRDTMVERAPRLVTEWAAEMTRRLIFGMASLREKLIVFDAGLDDRVIEAMKLSMSREARIPFVADGYLYFVELDRDDMIFEYAVPGMDTTARLPVSRAHHDALRANLDPVRQAAPRLFDSFIVDHRVYHVIDETP